MAIPLTSDILLFIPATFSGDVATFPVGSVSATFSGAATFLGMRFHKNVAYNFCWLHFLAWLHFWL